MQQSKVQIFAFRKMKTSGSNYHFHSGFNQRNKFLIFVYILQGKMGETEEKWREEHAIKANNKSRYTIYAFIPFFTN